MGWSFRKSINIGPLRINLSKSGIGLSAGVKGARVSVGPKGTQLHLGKDGVYYQKTLSSPDESKHSDQSEALAAPVSKEGSALKRLFKKLF